MMPLLEMLRLPSEKIRVEKVVELVSYDGAIAAQCLRLANSPLFGMRYIETVRSAVMALGLERVRSILFGLCMNRVIPKDKWVISSDAFWRHSLGCALVTQRMAKKIGYSEPEKAYLAGLLHDLGFLVNSILYTEDFRECLRRAAEQHVPLHVTEEQVLGFTHGETGQLLSEHWGLPKELVDAARCHHDLSLLPTAGPLACLVHLGDLLCRVRYLGYGYDEILGSISAAMRRGKPWFAPILRLKIWTLPVSRSTLTERWSRSWPRWIPFLESRGSPLPPQAKAREACLVSIVEGKKKRPERLSSGRLRQPSPRTAKPHAHPMSVLATL